MFFPSTVEIVKTRTNNPDVEVEVDYTELEADLLALTELTFDEQFEAVFAKMLRIGTDGTDGATIANREKGPDCPAL
jgi:hypothetical protein